MSPGATHMDALKALLDRILEAAASLLPSPRPEPVRVRARTRRGR